MKVLNIQEQGQGGKYVAIFDFEFWIGIPMIHLESTPLTIKNLKVFRSKKGGYFISWPAFKASQDPNDKTWIDYAHFNFDVKKQLESEMLQQLKAVVHEMSFPA